MRKRNRNTHEQITYCFTAVGKLNVERRRKKTSQTSFSAPHIIQPNALQWKKQTKLISVCALCIIVCKWSRRKYMCHTNVIPNERDNNRSLIIFLASSPSTCGSTTFCSRPIAFQIVSIFGQDLCSNWPDSLNSAPARVFFRNRIE